MAEDKKPQDSVTKLRELIKDIKIAMLTTSETDGTLRSRPMGTQQTEFDGDLWFFTAKSSGKITEIQHDQHVNVSYAAPDDNRYVSVSGRAELIDDKAKAKELWNPFIKAWFPKGLDDPDLVLLRVRVEAAEYWDAPSSTMVNLVGFAKAVLTGKRPDIGENEKLSL
ncbi:MAG: pyridoxamine 5'-phosphate oxidase family protein [Chloroflexi bacterium]|nr:pyridoxamine 5'-phosphate oxidase family protein [Chloroflexota bacterium]OJV95967.1 MAG: general stress protein [Chloroflexi bacterium 54-19]